MIWIADAHRGHAKRFIVRADEKLTVERAFVAEVDYGSIVKP